MNRGVAEMIAKQDFASVCAYFNTYPERIDKHCRGGQFALHLAISNLPMIKFLLQSGANVNIRDGYAKTPLHYASQLGLLQCMKELILHGAHLHVVGWHNTTPYTLGSRSVQRLLLDSGLRLSELRIHHQSNISLWTRIFVGKRKRVRRLAVIFIAVAKTEIHRNVIVLIAQWVWAMRGCALKQ